MTPFRSSVRIGLVSFVALTIVLQIVRGAAVPPEPQGNRDEPDYWLKRKDWFYRRTRFNLAEDNLKVLGAKRLIFENKSAQPIGHLPFWFDYELYKKVFNKQSGSVEEDVERHNAYISTCMRVLKARTLFRMLAGTSDTFITDSADKFHWEKFGPIKQALLAQGGGSSSSGDISVLASFQIEQQLNEDEPPLERAIRLVRQEMERVESKNQVEWYLRAFNESDGSAIKGKLPY